MARGAVTRVVCSAQFNTLFQLLAFSATHLSSYEAADSFLMIPDT